MTSGDGNVTIKDVASRARVSWKTVSNVVHDRPHVRPETRERVLTAIAELGYRPSIAGRQLRQGRLNSMTLVVPELANPYFAKLFEAAYAAAAARGYSLFMEIAGSAAEPERAAIDQVLRFAFDAALISPTWVTGRELTDLAAKRPVILLGESAWEAPLDRVLIDNVQAADDVTTHLLQSGRRRVAFVGMRRADQPEQPTAVRLAGYRRALRRFAIDLDPDLLVAAPRFDREDGYAGVRELLQRVPDVDALMCVNDLVAIGALRALGEAGRRVPEDVAVTGWDAIDEAAWSAPALTTVDPDIPAIAEAVVDLAVARVEQPQRAAQEVVVPHRIVVRRSSAPVVRPGRFPDGGRPDVSAAN